MAQGHRHDDQCCGGSPLPRVEAAVLRMKERSLRVTTPRLAMLNILAEATRPMSAEEIHAAAGDGTLDLVTVYRSLGALDEAGSKRSFGTGLSGIPNRRSGRIAVRCAGSIQQSLVPDGRELR